MFCLLLLSCAGPFAKATKLAEAKQWEIGTPIVGYYHGPGGGIDTRFGPLTPGMARRLVDGGFNLAWGTTAEDLDVAHAHGLRVDLIAWDLREPGNLDDPVVRARMDALIESVKDHPALYSYQITDEPSAIRFPEFARIVEYLRERDPAHLAHMNLFPTYASAVALGTAGGPVEAYREHLRQFVDVVKPDLISYDHYNLYTDDEEGTNLHQDNQYFMNLALAREASLYGGIPFINVIQAVSVGVSHRIPTGAESRYLGYTTLAYGGQGISHFTYWPYGDFYGGITAFEDVGWNTERAAADVAAPLTPLGEAVRQIHPEFIAVAEQLQPLTSLAVYHSGRMPAGTWPIDELPAAAVFSEDPPLDPEQGEGILWGYFGSTGASSHVLIVNLDFEREITTTVVGPGTMEQFDARVRQWRPVSDGSRAQVNLVAGGGMLLRLQVNE